MQPQIVKAPAKVFTKMFLNNLKSSLSEIEVPIESIYTANINNANRRISDDEAAEQISRNFQKISDIGARPFKEEDKELARAVTVQVFRHHFTAVNEAEENKNSDISQSSSVFLEVEKEASAPASNNQSRFYEPLSDQERACALGMNLKSDNESEISGKEIEIDSKVLACNFQRLWCKVYSIIKRDLLKISIFASACLGAGLLIGSESRVFSGVVGGFIGLAASVACSFANYYFNLPRKS